MKKQKKSKANTSKSAKSIKPLKSSKPKAVRNKKPVPDSKHLSDLETEEIKVLELTAAEAERKYLIRHLDERLQTLHRRTAIIEKQLLGLSDNRFYRTCIFGSARIKPDSKLYNDVHDLARFLAWEGIDVLTGGGPGLMEAANIGAAYGKKERKTRSMNFGISIDLPFEPHANSHLDIKRHHHKFSSRLDDFMRLSHSIICTPGGIGTVLELFFSWQLIQVKHIGQRPIVLLGKDYWQGLIDWMKTFPLGNKLVSPEDFDFIHIADSPQEAAKIIHKHHQEFRTQTATLARK